MAYDITGGSYTDATSTVLSGAASVSGDVITVPVLKSLTVRNRYQVEVEFETADVHLLEAYVVVEAER
jgi:hypothetical protein